MRREERQTLSGKDRGGKSKDRGGKSKDRLIQLQAKEQRRKTDSYSFGEKKDRFIQVQTEEEMR
jgi:hypothetical protein